MSLQNLVPFKTLLQLPMEDLQRRAEDPNETIPGYLLLSAMKAKGAMQAGVQQPVLPTVKEQVVARATQPTPGIGAMMPQQEQVRRFQGGGSTNPTVEDLNRMIWERIRSPFDKIAAEWDKVKGKSRNKAVEQRYPATIPTEPTGPYRLEGHQYPASEFSNGNAGNSTANKEIAPQRSGAAGVTSVGVNPTSKYKEFPKYDVTARELKALKDIEVPEIPTNAAYGRTLKDIDEEMSGIRSAADKDKFAAIMSAIAANATKHGRGWGASAGPTLSAATEAGLGVQKAADKELAGLRGLRRKTDVEAEAEKAAIEGKMYDRRLAERGFDVEERKFEVERADKAWKAGFDITDATNKQQIALEELNIRRAQVGAQYAAIRESAAARKDAQLFNVIQRLDAQAATASQKASEAVWDSYKNDHRLLTGDPVFRALVGAEASQAATKALTQAQRMSIPYLKAAGIPLPDMSPAATSGTAKRAFPGS